MPGEFMSRAGVDSLQSRMMGCRLFEVSYASMRFGGVIHFAIAPYTFTVCQPV
jgi:hypothetical protein